jgi:SMI1 / KNR4 family (SUKH-1)
LILEKFFQLAQEIVASGRIGQDQIQGLSDHEIRAFEQRKGFMFPKAYVEFLSFCGKSGAYELTSLDFEIEWDNEIRGEIFMQANMDGSIVPVVYNRSIFFSGDGHGAFYYFASDFGGNDPEVFRWDDFEEVREISQKFSEFVFSRTLSYDLIKQERSNS